MQHSIGKILTIGFLCIIVMLCLETITTVNRLSELGVSLREVTGQEMQGVIYIGQMKNMNSGRVEDTLHKIITRSNSQYPGHSVHEENNIARTMQAYRAIHADGLDVEEKVLIEKFDRQLAMINTFEARINSLVQQGKIDEAKNIFYTQAINQHRLLMVTLDRLSEFEMSQVAERAVSVEEGIVTGRKVVIALAIIGIVISIALGAAISFSLARPVNILISAMERINRGDPVSINKILKEDQAGTLTRRFNEMLDQMHKAFEEACHEMRTPLTIIRGEAEVALRGQEKTGEQYRTALKCIATVSDQLGQFFDGFMFLKRSEVGQVQYDMSPVAMKSVLEQVVSQCRGLAILKQISLNVELSSPFSIFGDVQRIRQLFIILLDNAIKYTNPNGEITVSLFDEAGTVRVRVEDSGIGIPEHDLPHIFERFYRADIGKLQTQDGNGLGLCIARSIIQIHQGEITVDSSPGKGTVVTVLFPPLAAFESEQNEVLCVSY